MARTQEEQAAHEAALSSLGAGWPPELPMAYPPAPASIISSRMTDVASDDDDPYSAAAASRRSVAAGAHPAHPNPNDAAGAPRPPSTWSAPSRPHLPPPLRRSGNNDGTSAAAAADAAAAAAAAGSAPAANRNSIGSLMGRTPSVKSHVPSITSHAFFHPMSSQKLQAQRAQQQPSTQQHQPQHDQQEQEQVTAGAGPDPDHDRSIQAADPDSASATPNLGRSLTDSMTRPQEQQQHQEQPQQHSHAAASPPPFTLPPSIDADRYQASVEDDPEDADGGGDGGSKQAAASSSIPASPHPHDPAAPLSPARSLSPTRPPSSSSHRPVRLGPHPVDLSKLETVSQARRARLTKARSAADPTNSDGKVHQFFDGNTVFCCGGRLQNSRQRPLNVITCLLIIAPAVVFYVFIAPWHWRYTSPTVPVFFGYLLFLCLSSFFHASTTDPGVLPRNLHSLPPPPPPAPGSEADPIPYPTNDWTLVRTREPGEAGGMSAMDVPIKYCRTCNIWRPPRAHHCRMCDSCIETHDHHCVWLNTCVGRRNYRHFFMFVFTTAAMSLYLIGATVSHLVIVASVQPGRSLGPVLRNSSHDPTAAVAIALAAFGFVGFLYPTALVAYHVFLTCRGETTREFIGTRKFPKGERYRAFSQGGWLRNWIAALCRPRTPSYYLFKSAHTPGDQRLAAEARRRRAWWAPLGRLSKRWSQREGEKVSWAQGVELQDVAKGGPRSPV